MPTLKSSPDIVFAVSPANAQSAYMPFYFLYLAGYLEKCGYTVEILNPHEKDLEANIGLILRELAIKRPRYVGLSCFVTDFNIITDLAARIKHSIIGTRILVGNAHPSIAPEDFISEHSPFDIVVRGEGELTVAEILSHPAEVSEPGIIRGIAYLKEGKPMITQNRELMDLAECGMPAYHLIDVEWYKKIRKSIIRRLATVGAVIYTGRGCPFQCTFCASNTVWQANDATREHPLVRKRPLAHVMQDLGILQNVHGFDFFYILDDTFGIREEDAIAFCDAYRASGLRMLWGAETRASCIRNERIVSILREAGCIQLDFGVESGSPRMLKSIKKGCDVGQIAKAFELCRKGGLRTFANVLINLPGEQAADLAKTEGLLAEIKPTYTSIGVTQPYPGHGDCRAPSGPGPERRLSES